MYPESDVMPEQRKVVCTYLVSTFHVLAKTFLKTVRFEVSPQVLKSETQHEALLLVLLFCSITLTASAYTVYVAVPMMPAIFPCNYIGH